MLGFAGRDLDLEFVFLDPAENPPAAAAGSVLQFPFDSELGLQKLAAMTDVITYEFENVPVSALQKIQSVATIYPPAAALACAQDRLAEKQLFREIGIPIADFRTVDSTGDLHRAAIEIGLPIVLKTRRLGYDGKGQCIVNEAEKVDAAVTKLGVTDLIAEQKIAFDREMSVIGTRNVSGQICIYPLSENVHKDGILNISRAPADAASMEATAHRYLRDLLERLDYVGTLALELFAAGEQLLANEFAPRVHNSGHWTIEGARTSQFENHLRAILDLPLGDPGMCGFAGMQNLIGRMPSEPVHLNEGDCYLHDYGKSARPGRKLGHVTVVADSPAAREAGLSTIAANLPT